MRRLVCQSAILGGCDTRVVIERTSGRAKWTSLWSERVVASLQARSPRVVLRFSMLAHQDGGVIHSFVRYCLHPCELRLVFVPIIVI